MRRYLCISILHSSSPMQRYHQHKRPSLVTSRCLHLLIFRPSSCDLQILPVQRHSNISPPPICPTQVSCQTTFSIPALFRNSLRVRIAGRMQASLHLAKNPTRVILQRVQEALFKRTMICSVMASAAPLHGIRQSPSPCRCHTSHCMH